MTKETRSNLAQGDVIVFHTGVGATAKPSWDVHTAESEGTETSLVRAASCNKYLLCHLSFFFLRIVPLTIFSSSGSLSKLCSLFITKISYLLMHPKSPLSSMHAPKKSLNPCPMYPNLCLSPFTSLRLLLINVAPGIWHALELPYLYWTHLE